MLLQQRVQAPDARSHQRGQLQRAELAKSHAWSGSGAASPCREAASGFSVHIGVLRHSSLRHFFQVMFFTRGEEPRIVFRIQVPTGEG